MRQLPELYHDRFHSFRLQSLTFTEYFFPMFGAICTKREPQVILRLP